MSIASLRPAGRALICCAALAIAGCESISDDAQRSSLAALRTEAPAPRKPLDLKAAKGCVESDRRSLAPRALPRPGQMPRGTLMREIQDDGQLVAGVDQNTLGLGYYDPRDGVMKGLDIALVREVARAIFGDLDRRIDFRAISTQQRESAIIDGDVDIVASAFTVTCKRRSAMLFSDVYLVAQQRLLVSEDSPVARLSDLHGKRVCATSGSTSIEHLDDTDVIAYPVPLRSDCLVKLQEGAVEAITSDDTILLGFRKQDPRTKIVGPSLRCEHLAMAINKDDREFVRFVNAVLARLRRDGKLVDLRRKWLDGLEAAPGKRPC